MKYGIEILLMLIIIVVVLLVVDITRISDAKSQCIKNPLVYGVKAFENANSRIMTCSCSFSIPNSPILFVTNSNMTVQSNINPSDVNVDVTKFKFEK